MAQTQAERIVIIDEDGLRGTCDRLPKDVERIWATFGGRRVRVPTEQLVVQDDGTYRLPFSLSNYLDEATGDAIVIPVVAETATLHKVRRPTGKVRVSTSIYEEEEEITVPLMREAVEVERVPVDRVVDAPVSSRREGDTLILSVMEEVLVVEKKFLLKEEVHIKMTKTEVEQTERVTLRKETVSVEHLDVEDDVSGA